MLPTFPLVRDTQFVYPRLYWQAIEMAPLDNAAHLKSNQRPSYTIQALCKCITVVFTLKVVRIESGRTPKLVIFVYVHAARSYTRLFVDCEWDRGIKLRAHTVCILLCGSEKTLRLFMEGEEMMLSRINMAKSSYQLHNGQATQLRSKQHHLQCGCMFIFCMRLYLQFIYHLWGSMCVCVCLGPRVL